MTPRQYNEYQRQADVIEQAKKWKEEQEKKQIMKFTQQELFMQKSERYFNEYKLVFAFFNITPFLLKMEFQLFSKFKTRHSDSV